MRPEIAAKVAGVRRQLHRLQGRRPADGRRSSRRSSPQSFPEAALKNIKWYPAVPPGIEEIEGRVLDRIKAAN